MADEWKDETLPKADGQPAPAVWDDNKKEWSVPEGRDGRQLVRDDSVERQLKELNDTVKGSDGDTKKVEVDFPDNFPDKDVKSELESIKETQSDIIDALKETNDTLQGTLDTKLTGSLVEKELDIDSNELNKDSYLKFTIDMVKAYYRLSVVTEEDSTLELYDRWKTESDHDLDRIKSFFEEDDSTDRLLSEKRETQGKKLVLRVYNRGDDKIKVNHVFLMQYDN